MLKKREGTALETVAHPCLDWTDFILEPIILKKSFSQEKVEWIEEPVDRWNFILRILTQCDN